MENILTTILTGNISTVIIVLILWKAGVLKYLLDAKKGNGELQAINATMQELKEHYNDAITPVLKDIKSILEKHSDKLDQINENVVWLKAKTKNGS